MGGRGEVGKGTTKAAATSSGEGQKGQGSGWKQKKVLLASGNAEGSGWGLSLKGSGQTIAVKNGES